MASTTRNARIDPVAALPWGAGSFALHLVMALLLGMGGLVRPVDGTGSRAEVPEDPPSVVLQERHAPEFLTDSASIEPSCFQATPPPPEILWPRPEGAERACGPAFPDPDPESVLSMPDPGRPRLTGVRLGRDNHPTGGGGSGAILAALRWLARHQLPDGMWTAKGCRKECLPDPGHEDFDVGITSLAALAFSRAGYSPAGEETHDGISFGAVMRKAISGLVSRQDPAGCVGSRAAQKYMYNHVLATLALAEATRHSTLFRQEVRKATEFLLRARNPGKGWRYSYKCGDNDTSVTCWATLALIAAEPFLETRDDDAYRGATAWLDEVTEKSYGVVSYTQSAMCRLAAPSLGGDFDQHLTPTALAAAVRGQIIGASLPEHVRVSLDLLLRDRPKWDSTLIDFVYWHAGTLAFKTVDDGMGQRWHAWKQATLQSLLPHQKTRGCLEGSWDPVDRWGGEGGRVYATAINALTLEVLAR